MSASQQVHRPRLQLRGAGEGWSWGQSTESCAGPQRPPPTAGLRASTRTPILESCLLGPVTQLMDQKGALCSLSLQNWDLLY